MQDMILTLAQDGIQSSTGGGMSVFEPNAAFLALAAIALAGAIVIIAIVFGSMRSVSIKNAREKTKREIAAYIAEGTMTPEDGERILKADDPSP